MFRTLLAAAAFAGLCAFAPTAQAAEPPTRTISYADLDLNDPIQAKRLLRRIDRAARQVCGWNNGRADLETMRFRRECRVTAVQNAVYSINRAHLNEAFWARFPV